MPKRKCRSLPPITLSFTVNNNTALSSSLMIMNFVFLEFCSFQWYFYHLWINIGIKFIQFWIVLNGQQHERKAIKNCWHCMTQLCAYWFDSNAFGLYYFRMREVWLCVCPMRVCVMYPNEGGKHNAMYSTTAGTFYASSMLFHIHMLLFPPASFFSYRCRFAWAYKRNSCAYPAHWRLWKWVNARKHTYILS